jgi:AcrR family transcriptional regulator
MAAGATQGDRGDGGDEGGAAEHKRGKQGTRDRVLQVALALFNQRGADRVTTADIAQAAGINEGNLYYYFQRKEALILALFDFFAAAALATAEQIPAGGADPAAYTAYQRGWFAVMWEYRFFYRDGGALRVLAPSLREGLVALRQRSQTAVRAVFGQMRANGLMAATDDDIDGLIGNIFIVSSYWMDYRLAEQGGEIGAEDLAWGLRQVERLVLPYLRRP